MPQLRHHKRFRIFVVAVLLPDAQEQTMPVEYTLQVRVKQESAVRRRRRREVDTTALELLGHPLYSDRFVSPAAVRVHAVPRQRISSTGTRLTTHASQTTVAESIGSPRTPRFSVRRGKSVGLGVMTERLMALKKRQRAQHAALLAAWSAIPCPFHAMDRELRGMRSFRHGERYAHSKALRGDVWTITDAHRPLCISIFPRWVRLAGPGSVRSHTTTPNTAHATPFATWNPKHLNVKGMAVLYELTTDAHGQQKFCARAAGYLDPDVVSGTSACVARCRE